MLESKGFAVLLIVSGVILLLVMVKSRHFFKALFLSVLQGVSALFAVNLLTAFTGVALSVNAITLAISAVAGIPGVILLLAGRLLFM